MRRQRQAFADLGAAVLVLTFEPPGEAVSRYARALRLPFPLLCDPERAAYTAFGLGRAAGGQVWGLASAKAYLRGLSEGRLPWKPRGDLAQLGGDVVLDSTGRVVYRFLGATPAARPSVAVLLAAVKSAGDAAPE